MKRLVRHIKRWNKWRKRCANGWLYKITVLLGRRSPTFQLTLTDEEIAEMKWNTFIAMRQKQRNRDQEWGEWVDRTIEALKREAE